MKSLRLVSLAACNKDRKRTLALWLVHYTHVFLHVHNVYTHIKLYMYMYMYKMYVLYITHVCNIHVYTMYMYVDCIIIICYVGVYILRM